MLETTTQAENLELCALCGGWCAIPPTMKSEKLVDCPQCEGKGDCPPDKQRFKELIDYWIWRQEQDYYDRCDHYMGGF